MKTNKILLGGIAGGVAFFLLGWIVYGILLKNFMAANMAQCIARPMNEMIWWAMILSNLAFGFLLTMVFSWSNITSVTAGAKVAGIIGLLVALSIDLSFYAMSTLMSKITGIFIDIIAYTFMSAIAGTAIVWVMGMGKK